MKKISKSVIILLTITLIIICFKSTVKESSKLGNLFIYTDVDYRLAKMSLKEKIGQMIIVDFRNFDNQKKQENKTPLLSLPKEYADAINELNIGGVILFSEALESASQIVELINQAQMSRTSENNPNRIPLLVSIDQEGGYITRLKTGTIFPGNMALAATNKPEYSYLEGKAIASELSALGINCNFAPVVDINSNPKNPIIGIRSYSDDANKVVDFSKEFISGQNENNVISTIKHFPGHGDTDVDSHTGLPVVNKTYDELKSFEIKPFETLINDGAEMILTAHIQYPLIENETYHSSLLNEDIILPATLSKTILNDLLRNELGFSGVVVSDSLVMDAIDTYFSKEDTAKLAINAGVDMLLMPIQIENPEDLKELEEYIDSIEKMVLNGEIAEETINEHVKRILLLKANHNLLKYDQIDLETKINYAINTLNSKEHHELEYLIANDAITEYKNDGLLPLKIEDNQKITIIYPYTSAYLPLLNGIQKAKEKGYINETNKVEFIQYSSNTRISNLKKLLSDTDYLIIVSSVYDHSEIDMESNNCIKIKLILELIDTFRKSNRKVIAISSHLPYDAPLLKEADSVILTYNSKGHFENPEILNGENPSFSILLDVAINKLFEGSFNGILPVKID